MSAPAVVVAPNPMRGHLDAPGVAAALARGVTGAAPDAEVLRLPLADGGDGTLDVVAAATGGTRRRVEVPDALGRARATDWLRLGGTALVESARCCGLAALAGTPLDPLRSTSAGVGVAVADAVRAGHREVLVGLGGTATVDGGAGALAALGARFEDATGRSVPVTPGTLHEVVRVDLGPARDLLAGVRLRFLADVSTTYSSNSARFGAQKGLGAAERPVAAAGMAHLVALLARADPQGGPAELHERCAAPWWGAGGGIGVGLSAVAAATATGGTLAVLAMADPGGLVAGADLVVTAEGVVDASTWTGKVPGAVAALRREHGRPTAIVAARFEEEAGASGRDAAVHRHLLAPGGAATLPDRLAAAGAAVWRHHAARPRPPATSTAPGTATTTSRNGSSG
ncbi:glycerate kinase [Pseudonocardia sp. ICBG1293]|uniref:glycerate kinase n=1 Tax=Pseudonocardia sp. ICBG1293 TaxID=2844382 RepID=UPI001CC9D515|nr:glycerate kinase [Pseudonocardia sp. ICBG1293]